MANLIISNLLAYHVNHRRLAEKFLAFRNLSHHLKSQLISSCLLLMASSSSVSCGSLYDVFLSFRGEDVRKGFLSHVVKEFKSKGISPFIDNEMERGKSVGPTLVGAIRQSKVAIVLLSRNYASSSWCLDELVEIMKCREEDQQRVITVFYEVDPSDVRKQTGDFGKAFDETCVGKTEEVTHVWRQALKDVAGIAGYASSNWESEADLINELATNIMGVLPLTPSNDFDDFVGIEPRVTKMKTMLSLQTKEVKVIGIWGPAGIGKTTAARVLYDQVSPGFSFSTFLEDIKGDFGRPCGSNDRRLKLRFQEKLLSQIFNQNDIVVGHLGVAPQRLCDKKVLVVLDEVDSWWQLEEMAKRAWFGRGSMVIITTEDRKLLKALKLEANQIYEMKLPTRDEALEIFCLYAFDQKFPNYGFESLAWKVTKLAGKLPLGLRVMGSYLRGMSKNEWIDALPSLTSSLHGEIDSTLKWSYDVLSTAEKALFLHIACFFVGSYVDSVKSILEKSDLSVNHGLQTLAYRSLIYIEYGFVRMHSLLQQMGEEIVYGQSAEPGKRQFLTKATEISEFFDVNTETGTVLGIKLLNLEDEEAQISKNAFQGMNHLQFIYIDIDSDIYTDLDIDNDGSSLNIPEGLNCFPDKLRYLRWTQFPLRFWPSKFSGKYLVELIMPYSSFEKLWEGIKPLPCLKLMDLYNSPYLKEIPDLSKATSLEDLYLGDCVNLLELTSSIGNATRLRVCTLENCCLLKELPSSFGRLINLKVLNMSGLSDLKKFPNVPYSIVELNLSGTGIEEVPSWIENLYHLKQLTMVKCRNLEIVSPNISKLENLHTIDLCTGKGGRYRCANERIYDDGYFEAEIKWGPDLNCPFELSSQWKLRSDLDIHYILPICLPEKALTSPISSLLLFSESVETIPDCIRRLSGLSELESITARFLRSLRRINSSFQNPNICLQIQECFNLNQKAKNLIQTLACKYAFLPGKNVPAHFPHRAISTSLTIGLTPRPLPSVFRFKACVVLSERPVNYDLLTVSCHVRGKQNGFIVPYESNQLHHVPNRWKLHHLYIFEDSFSINQDSPEAEDATFSELSFLFTVSDDKVLKIWGCGVRILEVLDGKETEYQEYIDTNIEANNETTDDDDEGDDDDYDMDWWVGVTDDVEDDVDDNAGFSDEVIINMEANNETEEGKESGRGEGVETRSRKRVRLSLV